MRSVLIWLCRVAAAVLRAVVAELSCLIRVIEAPAPAATTWLSCLLAVLSAVCVPVTAMLSPLVVDVGRLKKLLKTDLFTVDWRIESVVWSWIKDDAAALVRPLLANMDWICESVRLISDCTDENEAERDDTCDAGEAVVACTERLMFVVVSRVVAVTVFEDLPLAGRHRIRQLERFSFWRRSCTGTLMQELILLVWISWDIYRNMDWSQSAQTFFYFTIIVCTTVKYVVYLNIRVENLAVC